MIESLPPETLAALIGLAGTLAALRKEHKDKLTAVSDLVKTVNFFDPAEETQALEPVISTTVIPSRSWTMNDSVKKFLLHGHSIEVQDLIIDQIQDAEAAKKCKYTINYPSGYYKIEYGNIAGSATW